MPEFGFPSQPRNHSMSLVISALRNRSDDSRVEAVSGRFADVTSELGGRVSELMQIEKSIGDLKDFSETIALAEARATVTQQSLSRVRDVGQLLADTTDLLKTNGTSQNFEAVSAQAREELGSVVSALNTQFAGRPLFAGDDGNGTTVLDHSTIQALAVPFLEAGASASAGYSSLISQFTTAGATFDTSIYFGGAGDAPSALIGQGESVDYSAKADERPLRTIMANIAALGAAYDMSNSIPDAQRRQLAELASEGLRSDVSQIIGIEGRVGSAENRIATIKARNVASEASLTLSFNNLAGADQLDATLELTELERQLETAFATTARMSNLSLVNFL